MSERYQNWMGIWLSRRRSEEIHCTMNRAAKTNWPVKPMRTQKSQVRGSRLMMASRGLGVARSQRGGCAPETPRRRDPETSSQLLPNPILQHPLSHPPHGHAIRQSSEGAIHGAVLRRAEAPRAVVDRHLRHFVAGHAHQRGEEAMHASVEADFVHRFLAHELERAAGVGDLVAGDPVAHAV